MFIVTMFDTDTFGDPVVSVLPVVGSLQACQKLVLQRVCEDFCAARGFSHSVEWRRVANADVAPVLDEHFVLDGCDHLTDTSVGGSAKKVGSYSARHKTYCDVFDCYRFQDPIYTIWEALVLPE